MKSINSLALDSLRIALLRNKVTIFSEEASVHQETCDSLREEVDEFLQASECKPSEHLPEYTEAVEELADIALVALTELSRRGVNVEKVLLLKNMYNERRND